MTSYLAWGFYHRDEYHWVEQRVVVDAEDYEDAHAKLRHLFGDRYFRDHDVRGKVQTVRCDRYQVAALHELPRKIIPEAAKNIVFMSYEELAAAPDLNRRKKAGR